jgi:hypothetical protein
MAVLGTTTIFFSPSLYFSVISSPSTPLTICATKAGIRVRRWMLPWRRLLRLLRPRTRARMPAGAGGLGRARPFGEHSNDRHQEAKEHNLFHVPPSGRWCVLGASA